ncbi:glycosyltransferase [Bradyrhizobium liaoningense]|uniref:glycosyltransferase n=1 Tax=Bradyrhizobium liaoningense TaxID=43992 RepID=UPI002896CB4D|nr:glycosyltransferase [Bradyrhizobium liaoningense]
MKTISVVTPCYNEELNVRDCYDAVRRVFDERLQGYRREHIFCDNAYDDRTVDILREIAAGDPSIKIIINARNFGPLRNTFNGVMAAGGDAVLLFMPADLQDPPELIPDFMKLWEGLRDRLRYPGGARGGPTDARHPQCLLSPADALFRSECAARRR